MSVSPISYYLQLFPRRNLTSPLRDIGAAIDANAPLPEDVDTNGPVDSDEERDTVMAAIARSAPKPLAEHTLISTKSKYRIVRIKEQMLHAIGGRGGAGLFSTDESQPLFGRNLFQPFDPDMNTSSSPVLPAGEVGDGSVGGDGSRKTPVQGNRKTPVAAAS